MAQPALRLILGDQLSPALSALRDADPVRDVILMAEVMAEATYVRHHRKKLVLVFSAMRHFAAELRAAGFRVDYVHLDDPGNTGALAGEAARALNRHGLKRLVITEPGEWRLLSAMRGWAENLGVETELREDTRFLCTRAAFADWAAGRRRLVMEYFYREMRRRHRILLDDAGEPEGGRWNFDAENRKPAPGSLALPAIPAFGPDVVTRDVMDLVGARFADHFGDLEPFTLPVTRADAETARDDFLRHRLPRFGDHQDAMVEGADVLFHSLLSPALNTGLLDPLDLCRRAEAEYRAGRAPLNAAEGFIRQILGWREFVRGVYWQFMPEYRARNALNAQRALPDFYWTGQTQMACVRAAVDATRRNAYAHHIQRLMVTGNLALLLGVHPDHVNDWYMAVYADAYEWVELPNTHGMALFADGGVVGTKPYAASGAYIDRMSDHCRGCAYDVKAKAGPRACPFNPLYWNFLIENRARLEKNPRMAMPYRTLARMDRARREEIRRDAVRIIEEMGLTP